MTGRPDPAEAVATARANLARLEERRLAALDGAGLAPHPDVIAAAEAALAAAEGKARKPRTAQRRAA